MSIQRYSLSDSLTVEIEIPSSSSSSLPSITIYKDDSVLWRSISNQPYILLGNNTNSNTAPIVNGNYQINDVVSSSSYLTDSITIDNIIHINNILNIYGNLTSSFNDKIIPYNMSITSSNNNNNNNNNNNDIKLSIVLLNYTNTNVIYIRYYCDSNEGYYGFGEQYNHLNLKGKRIPIVVSEQGVGRGLNPLTNWMNNNTKGSGGNEFTTYAPKPLYITSSNRSMLFDVSTISFFNLTSSSSNIVEVEVWDTNSIVMYVMKDETFLDAIESITYLIGRPSHRLPLWSQQGAVVGLEGGSNNVTKHIQSILQSKVPLVGVWLQDWVGIRHNTDGDRLIWNWEVNYDYYPQWNTMVSSLKDKGIRVLNYINPFFSNPINYTTYIKNNFYLEGEAKGYFVKDHNNQSYSMNSLTIQFYTLDLTNPDAVKWMKDTIIKTSLIGDANSSGFMCDFGEYLPFDAVLFNNESASSYHNKYAENWGRIVSEAISELNATDEIVFFMRSGYTYTSKYVNLFWLGDQLISYDAYDGMKTLIPASLSSGISGQSMLHSDIGGYNSFFTNTSTGMYYVRDQEILKRWSEFAAFGSSLFRTHIGSSMSNVNAQIYDDDDSLLHFKEFASIFGNLSEYRLNLMDIAIDKGHPLMLPMLAHYYYDVEVLLLPDPPTQFLFGSDFLVSPSMTKGETQNKVYIPAYSQFIHLWSGNKIETTNTGIWLEVPSSIGYPNVFYKSNSIYGNALRQFCIENGYTNGYSWNYNNDNINTTSNLLLYIIISISVLVVMIFTIIIYRMRQITNKRLKYDKLGITEILSPLNDDDDKESINY